MGEGYGMVGMWCFGWSSSRASSSYLMLHNTVFQRPSLFFLCFFWLETCNDFKRAVLHF